MLESVVWLLLCHLLSSSLCYCPGGCRCNNVRLEVSCLASKLDMIPITLNPHITSLEMRNTEMVRLDDSFQFYEALIDLDLSFNKINLILDKSFISQSQLKTLYLDHNKIENLHSETFFGLERLEYLKLSHNSLEKLPENLTHHCQNINTLDLSYNNLNSISREIFISASKLENLNLSNNLLSQIPQDLYLPGLKIFSLNNNPLLILNLCKLKGLEQLLNLMVRNTSLQAVGWRECRVEMAETPLVLEVLDISDNYLSSPLDLSPLGQLREISLGQRNLIRLTSKHMQTLPPSLSSLNISHSQLAQLEPGSLERFSQLSQLSISHNPQLKEVPVLLSSAPRPLTVDLSSNSLSALSSDCLPWNSVSRLDLTGNPLDCSCSLAWLLPLLPSLQHQGATCHLPLSLRGANISNLSQLDQCHASSHWTTAILLSSSTLVFLLLLLLSLALCHWRRHKAGVRDLSQPTLVFPEQSEDLELYWQWGRRAPQTEGPQHYPSPLYWAEQPLQRHSQPDKKFYNGIYCSLTQSRHKEPKSRNLWSSLSTPGQDNTGVFTLTDPSFSYHQRDIIYLDLLKDCGRH